jgi:hypothetical protein
MAVISRSPARLRAGTAASLAAAALGVWASAAQAAAPSTTTVTVTPNPAVAGQDVTFKATVAGATPGAAVPTGTLQFTREGAGAIGAPVPLGSDGSAVAVASGAAGSYVVHADYSGDANFDASGGTAGQTVNRADTVTTLESSANPAPSARRSG